MNIDQHAPTLSPAPSLRERVKMVLFRYRETATGS